MKTMKKKLSGLYLMEKISSAVKNVAVLGLIQAITQRSVGTVINVESNGDDKMKIRLRVIPVFGKERFYPDCQLGEIIIALKDTKCIGKRAVSILATNNVEISYTADKTCEFLDALGAKRV